MIYRSWAVTNSYRAFNLSGRGHSSAVSGVHRIVTIVDAAGTSHAWFRPSRQTTKSPGLSSNKAVASAGLSVQNRSRKRPSLVRMEIVLPTLSGFSLPLSGSFSGCARHLMAIADAFAPFGMNRSGMAFSTSLWPTIQWRPPVSTASVLPHSRFGTDPARSICIWPA